MHVEDRKTPYGFEDTAVRCVRLVDVHEVTKFSQEDIYENKQIVGIEEVLCSLGGEKEI